MRSNGAVKTKHSLDLLPLSNLDHENFRLTNFEISNGSLNSNLRGFSVSNLILCCILFIETLYYAMIFIRTYDESTNAALSKSYTNPIDRARSNVLSYLKLVWGVSAFDLFRATETRLVFSVLQFSPIKLEGHFVASKFWHEMKSVSLSFRFSVNGNKACWCKEEMLSKHLFISK